MTWRHFRRLICQALVRFSFEQRVVFFVSDCALLIVRLFSSQLWINLERHSLNCVFEQVLLVNCLCEILSSFFGSVEPLNSFEFQLQLQLVQLICRVLVLAPNRADGVVQLFLLLFEQNSALFPLLAARFDLFQLRLRLGQLLLQNVELRCFSVFPLLVFFYFQLKIRSGGGNRFDFV